MKPKSTLGIIAVFLFLFQTVSAQKKFTASPAASNARIGGLFSKYSLFTINTTDIADFVRSDGNDKADFELSLPGFADWQFSITQYDILSKDYKLIVNSPEGKRILPKPACVTYAGFLSDVAKSKVRLTIDNDVIYGMIKSADREFFIEPLRYLDRQASVNVFVVYEPKDVKADAGLTCGVNETAQRSENFQRLTAGTNCRQTQLAIASDESMFLRYGSAAAVQTHNIGVMNNVLWDYVNAQFADNIEFTIVTQNVSTSAGTDQLSPAYTGTNSGTILSNFRAWGEAGNFGTTYDVGQFWTTRNIDNDGAGGGSGTIGLAYVGAVCSSFRYHLLEDFNGSNPSGSGYLLRVLASHEIGHNFNCSHDGASGFIMAPSVNNTATWSAASITSVDAFSPGLGCLANCSVAGVPLAGFISSPEAICTGGTMQLTDHSLRGPTSWSWSMTGGSPASSSTRNPTVSYASSGVKLVTLTSTNGGGSGTPYSKHILVSNSPVTACSNTGSLASEGGIRSFTLNSINRVSGSANGDGNKYMDYSCSDVTSLVANTLYNATVNVGFFSSTNPTPPHIFNHVLFYIDYNNDGDFLDANETVYSSGGSAFFGNHNFSFTTIASPPVTNQFLRARIIARDFGGATGSCLNPSAGQVEDYSVYFAAGILLPVSLIDFSGYHYNATNILNWETSAEKDNSYFEIERSINGTQFESIGRKNAVQNSLTNNKYSFTDLLAGGLTEYPVLYYRLKMVDLSAKEEYSKVITITAKPGKNDMVLGLQPNPFTNNITAVIQLKSSTLIKMQLLDMYGRIVQREQRTLSAGIHTLTYNNFDRLAKGAYIITITGNNETTSRLIEKQ